MPDTINKQTLSEQIYTILRQDILNQEIKSGEKLTLQALKDRFNVSHTPIRDALTRLVEDDLVTYHSNVGITVICLTENDARELFELSGDLDCLALRYAWNGPFRSDLLGELEEIITESSQHLRNERYKEWSAFSDRFHLAFYKYANNSRLEKASQKLRAQTTLLSNRYQLENKNVEQIQQDHEGIYQALEAAQIEKALQLIREHLDHDMSFAIDFIAKTSP